jgi:hypothetical protein
MALQVALDNTYNPNQEVDRELGELIGTKGTNNSLLPAGGTASRQQPQ